MEGRDNTDHSKSSGQNLPASVDPRPSMDEEKPGVLFYACMVVLFILVIIISRYALMFAEALNNQ